MKRQILIVTALFFLSLVVPEGVFADAEGDLFSAAVEEIFDTYSSTKYLLKPTL